MPRVRKAIVVLRLSQYLTDVSIKTKKLAENISFSELHIHDFEIEIRLKQRFRETFNTFLDIFSPYIVFFLIDKQYLEHFTYTKFRKFNSF